MQVSGVCSLDVRRTSLAEMPCPVARTLDLIGEWWTILIVRDAFIGARKFEDFKSTGIADNILAARLRRLVDEGVLERRAYQSRPERFEYVLTPKGRALLPVVAALANWGQTWTEKPAGFSDRAPRLTHLTCGQELPFSLQCGTCGRAASPDEIGVDRRPAPAAVSA